MKTRRRSLVLAACAVGVFAFGTTAAQAATPVLSFSHAAGTASAPQAKKAPKPKEYVLCTEYFGGCGSMFIYTKTRTWETTSICWIGEGEECPGLGWLHGSYVKEPKAKVTYDFYGPYGEEDAGYFEVTKVKKSHPAKYEGTWWVYGGDYGLVSIET